MIIFGLVTRIPVKRESSSLTSLRCLSSWLKREREKVHGMKILLRFRWSGPAAACQSASTWNLQLCNRIAWLTTQVIWSVDLWESDSSPSLGDYEGLPSTALMIHRQ